MFVTEPNGLQHLLAVPGIYGVRIGEQQHQVDFVIGNPGVHLLVTSLLVGQQQSNGQPCGIRHQASRGGRCIEGMLGKDALVGSTKLNHKLLSLIVC